MSEKIFTQGLLLQINFQQALYEQVIFLIYFLGLSSSLKPIPFPTSTDMWLLIDCYHALFRFKTTTLKIKKQDRVETIVPNNMKNNSRSIHIVFSFISLCHILIQRMNYIIVSFYCINIHLYPF